MLSILKWLRENTANWAATWRNQQNECAPSQDSDHPGHPPSLIRVFAVRMKKAWVLSYPLSAQQRLWSDRVDAQAELSLRWAHSHFVGFVMSRLKWCAISEIDVSFYICQFFLLAILWDNQNTREWVGVSVCIPIYFISFIPLSEIFMNTCAF